MLSKLMRVGFKSIARFVAGNKIEVTSRSNWKAKILPFD